MALLSWSLLSAASLTLNLLPGDDVHISMYSMVFVLWCMCTCALVARLWSRFALADPLPSIGPWSLYPAPQQPLIKSATILALAASTWKYAQQSYCPTHSKMQHGTWAAFIAWECVFVQCVCVCFVCMYTGEGLICLYVGWVWFSIVLLIYCIIPH